MSPATIVRLAWPDVLERARRSSFFLTLGITVWLGSLVYTDNIQMWMGDFRGVVNSAWLGTVMALSATLFVSLVGFYVVKNAIERDRQLGVGQILAATPVSTRTYLVAKWLSNLVVLASIVATLGLAAVVLHLVQADGARLDVVALVAPLVMLALPGMAVVAAFAVVFETVPWLAGGVGNAVYFFVWNLTITMPLLAGARWADWTGITFVSASLERAVHAVAPGADAQISFTAGPAKDLSKLGVIEWPGVEWTAATVLMRLAWVVVAVGAVAAASGWFDRFDTTRAPSARRQRKARRGLEGAVEGRTRGRISRLAGAGWAVVDRMVPPRARFAGMVVAELKLSLRGLSAWWVLVAVALAVASLLAPAQAVPYLLVVAWFWPLLVWSKMGVRERQHRTGPLVFSSAHPIRRQFLASWTAGVIVALVTGAGFAISHLAGGDPVALGPWLAGAFFVPSLACALGVWAGTPRAFEALYTAWWYLGPMQAIGAADFTGAFAARTPAPTAVIYGLAAAGLLAIAIAGRRRQLLGSV